MRRKYSILFILFLTTIILFSCVSEPKEGKYKNYTYEEIVSKYGNPKYDNTYIIDNNFDLDSINPDYALYFTKEELENGSQVRKLLWENNYYRTIIWLKNINGQWIAFDSLEYNSKFVKF